MAIIKIKTKIELSEKSSPVFEPLLKNGTCTRRSREAFLQ